MVGQHHRLNGHEFEQTPGDRKGQGSLASCSPWGCKESNMTEQLNNNSYKSAWMCKAKYLIRQAVLWVREGVKEEQQKTAASQAQHVFGKTLKRTSKQKKNKNKNK